MSAGAARYPAAARTRFGDSASLSARLLALIADGSKTATCGALREYDGAPGGEPMPHPGDVVIAEDWDGTPALAYAATEVAVLAFRDVPEDFALAEGEGDFAAWRASHVAFFTRNGGWSEDLPVVCERFRLLEVFSREDV